MEPAGGERTLIEGLLHYISILLRYKWVIVIITAAAAVGVVGFSFLTLYLPPEVSPLPNFYTANAVLLVQSEDSGLSALSSVLSSMGLSPGGQGISYGDVALEVLQSRSILDALVEEFEIIERYEIVQNNRTNSRKAILGQSDFSFNPTTGTLNVMFTDIDPVFARDIVNRMIELLENWFTRWGGSANQRQIVLMEEKISSVTADIAELEQEIESLQLQYGVLSVEEIASAQTQMLSELRSQLMTVEMEIRSYTDYSTIEDEAVIRLRSQKDTLENTIDEVERGYTGGKKTMPARENLPRLAVKFARLQTDLAIQMQIYQSISEQYELLKLSTETGTIFDILEYAEISDEKSGPSRGRLCMIVTIMAFAGSIALALILNAVRNIWKDPQKRKLLKGKVDPQTDAPQ
jgi:tyrosine-protein kinase Etk/Wzc